MRIRLMLAGLAVAGLTATSALAEDGVYSGALTRILTEAADGTCSVDIMGPGLLAACQQQIASMSGGLKSLGPVQSVTLISSETTPSGLVETYRVSFQGGQTVVWGIGGLRDGKFDVAYTVG